MDSVRIKTITKLNNRNIRFDSNMSTDGLIRLYERHKHKVYSENLIDISDRIETRYYRVRDADRLKELKKLEKEDKNEL